jgi:FKBP-type peptidyl-prolyl cis-trans isomerase 2
MIWNKWHLSVFTFSLLFLLLASGCLKNDMAESEAKEKRIIQQYLNENYPSGVTKTEGGIYYIEEVPGTGSSPVLNDYVIVDFVVRYMETNIIRETSYASLKEDWTAAKDFSNFLFGPVKIKYGYNIAGINEGLSMMKEGGKAKIIIPSDKAYYDYNPLLYEIELIKVIRNPVVYEDSVLQAYRIENEFNGSTKLDSIWYKETSPPYNPADLRTVQTKDTVYFRFEGRIVDGFRNELQDNRKFDTTNYSDVNPVRLVFGQSQPNSGNILGLPKGLIMALDSMREGTHATALLRYKEAFGENGLINSIYRYTIVPKYQTIVYDIVVEKIAPPATIK